MPEPSDPAALDLPSLFTRRPEPVHRHSLIPRMSSLYLLISLITCAVLDVSNMVRTFHAARRMVVLGPSRLSVVLLTSRGLSSEGVIQPVGWVKSTMGSMVVVAFLDVSVTYLLFTGWSS